MKTTKRLCPIPFAALLTVLLLSGCATVPRTVEREESRALEPALTSALGKFCESHPPANPDLSGFTLLNEGRSAFLARTALADLAERSLDVQYFILKPDMTGSILVERLVKAAGRGVRVRLLIDDLNAGGQDFGLRALNACPNVEVRLYNPFGKHFLPRLGRGLEFVASFERLNHRMHNKLFIADNLVAVIGGRNIADSYFGADPAYNFRDFDLFSTGPVVREFSKSFDEFWNSAWAVPVGSLHSSRPSAGELEESYRKLQSHIAAHSEYPYRAPVTPAEDREVVGGFFEQLLWAPARVASDSPGKAKGPGSRQITTAVKELLDSARREILVVSPYLVPSDPDFIRKKLLDLRSRGIAICMMTNSLGSTDLVSTHTGYAKYRKLLVDCGVEIHEMRPDAESRAVYTANAGAASVMGLHGKAALVDQSFVFIGTFNFDQRSANINSEIGVEVHSPELARRIASAVALDLQGRNSWRVARAEDCDPGLQDREGGQDLVWIVEESGGRGCLAAEPGAGRGRLLLRSLMGLFPIDSQL